MIIIKVKLSIGRVKYSRQKFTKIMTYIIISTDKYQNIIVKQSYMKIDIFRRKSIPLYH